MLEREPITQTVKVSEARAQFSDLLNRVFRRQARVLVEKSGIPVAAIVSAQDLDRLNQMDAERQKDLAILDASQATFADVPGEQVEREISRAVAEVRAENRRTRLSTDRG
ncbi:MAG: type II toxin-antitoxin system prevent-host-death family antitoxin [Chloroflexota bacterium]